MFRLLMLVVFVLAGAHSAAANRYDDCGTSKDIDRQIRGCTEVIKGGERESRKNRATAYINRGIAYASKSVTDRAIADFTTAIQLKPRLMAAYYNRGKAFERKKLRDKAIADYKIALEIYPNSESTRRALKRLGVEP
jgi:tetratricopeptide (TPR) repeat protein